MVHDDPSTPKALGDCLIPAINKLQDIFAQVTLDFKLDLPQVAVVGSQSSGKSSVLEGLVGCDFLPRGSNIVTRRPLLLQLVKQPPARDTSPAKQEWGEFLHLPGKKFYDFALIRQEIAAETDRVVGTNKGVSDKPIRLKIYSPNVLTMTLVDLPGIAKLPVGDQPTDIEARIRRMVLDHIAAPQCIILAVTPANQDIVNSDALELAKSVDPHGHRTIGVLTKLDIMDRGTDAVGVLRNEAMPLKLGYIGVVNRSQQDINTNKSMAESRRAEQEFFSSHPEYGDVMDRCGMHRLAHCMNRLLIAHIRTLLPGLRALLEDALERRSTELATLGEAPPTNAPSARAALLLQLLDGYATRFIEMLDGRSEALPVSELAGGARIRHIFQEIFVRGLDELDPASTLSDDDIRTAIKNSGGVRGSLLLPDAPFELLVRRAIGRLLPPALQCKEFVFAELQRIAHHSIPPDVQRFPALQRQLQDKMEEFIMQGAAPADRMIRDLVACEHAYINTDHPSFIGGNRAIAQVMERRVAGEGAAAVGIGEDEDGGVVGTSLGGGGTNGTVHKAKSTGTLPSSVAPTANTAPGSRRVSRGSGSVDALTTTTVPRGVEPDGLMGVARAAATRRITSTGAAGVEPELLSPSELLAGGQPTVSSGEDSDRSAGSGSWFSSLFGRGAKGDPTMEPQLRQPPQTLKVQDAGSDQEQVQVEVTRLLVSSYFDIVRANLQDLVPKAVMHFLVNTVQRGLQQHLIKTIYSAEETYSQLLAEREDVATRRQQCAAAVGALKAAVATLDTLPAELGGRGGNAVAVGGTHGAHTKTPPDAWR